MRYLPFGTFSQKRFKRIYTLTRFEKYTVSFSKSGILQHPCVHACSVMSDSLQPHGLQPAKILCPWDFPGKNTGVRCHFLLQEILPTQGLNPCLLQLLHWQWDSSPLSHLEVILQHVKLSKHLKSQKRNGILSQFII